MTWVALQEKLSRFFQFSQTFQVYTDGSAKAGRGAWAYVIVKNGRVVSEASGKATRTSCNRMEFQAAIEALDSFSKKSRIELFSDSRVLIDALNLKARRTVYGSDQLAILDDFTSTHAITWCWIRAHSGNPHNERCDRLCAAARGN